MIHLYSYGVWYNQRNLSELCRKLNIKKQQDSVNFTNLLPGRNNLLVTDRTLEQDKAGGGQKDERIVKHPTSMFE